MKILLDTHIILWAAAAPERLPPSARALLSDLDHELLFSAASMWEVAIKASMGRADFHANARLLRRGLLDHELIKVKLLDAAPVSREAFALWVHEKTKADAIAWVGRTVIFYQKHPEKPKIHLPG